MVRLVLFLCLIVVGAFSNASALAQTRWLKAESDNFIVYGALPEQKLRDRVVLLERYDRLLRMFTRMENSESRSRLNVYLVRNASAFRTIGTFSADVAGFYTATPEGIAAFAVEGHDMGEQILLHEYAHHFMMQHAPSAYPGWYIEGFAEYFMTARFADNRIDVGDYSENRARWLMNGNWASLDDILFPGRRRAEPSMFYPQSWLLVHYFFADSERTQRLSAYLAALARGEEQREAFSREIGRTPRELTRDLRAYISSRRIRYTQISSEAFFRDTVPVTVSEMPASADAMLMLDAALRLGSSRRGGDNLLEQVRRVAARFPDDILARHTLARAEAALGDMEQAEPLLERLLAEKPGDGDLLYHRALLSLRRAEAADDPTLHRRDARSWLARAHDADPDHYPTLYQYALQMAGNEAAISENTSNVMLLAHQLAPQVADIRLSAASFLINRGNSDDAEALLLPLVSDVHRASTAEAARAMLDKIRQEPDGGASDGATEPN